MKGLPLPNLGKRRRVLRQIPALLAPLTVALYRAAIVEVANQWLKRGHSLSATSAALGMRTPTLCKLVHAARRDGPLGLVPQRFRSGRRPARSAERGIGGRPTPDTAAE